MMAVLALVLAGVWVLLTVGVRIAVQVRRTGDTGLRHGRHTPTELVAHVSASAAVLAVGVLAPVADLAGLDPVGPLAWPGLRVGGAVLASAGIVATLGAQLAMRDSWRIGVDQAEHTALVTTGPFRLVRNPIFTAVLVTMLGLVLMVGNVIALVGFVGVPVALELQVRRIEEPYLRRTHGGAYTAYAARVGRFLPGVGRLR